DGVAGGLGGDARRYAQVGVEHHRAVSAVNAVHRHVIDGVAGGGKGDHAVRASRAAAHVASHGNERGEIVAVAGVNTENRGEIAAIGVDLHDAVIHGLHRSPGRGTAG